MGFGTPLGAKNFRNFTNPCFDMAIIVTAKKMKKAIEKVTIMWLVQVKLNGNIPNKFPIRINMNNEKINDRYFIPDFPTLSSIILAINSYDNSNKDCFLDGIILELFNPSIIKRRIETIVIIIAREEFVKDISYPKISIGINVLISNCDSGLANYISL